jgi:hypothetical protein
MWLNVNNPVAEQILGVSAQHLYDNTNDPDVLVQTIERAKHSRLKVRVVS